MGLDRDSIDLFRDNLSRASIFARPRDHSSILSNGSQFTLCRPNKRTWPTREISLRSDSRVLVYADFISQNWIICEEELGFELS